MAKPRTRLKPFPVSRDLAMNLCVDASPAAVVGPGRDVDAAGVRALLAILSQASAIPVDGDEAMMRKEMARRYFDPGTFAYDYLDVNLSTLRRNLGRIGRKAVSTTALVASKALVSLRDTPQYGLSTGVRAFMAKPRGGRLRADSDTGVVQVERTLMAAATGTAMAVMVDPKALRLMRCRYTPILYLRCLEWLQSPPKGAKAGKNAKLWFEVPYAEAQRVLGTGGIPLRSNVTQNVMTPAMRELAQVGVDLSLKWIENYRGQPTALRIGVLSTPAMRSAAVAQRGRERAAAVAARRAARHARRQEAIRRQVARGEAPSLALLKRRIRYH